jgi:hypothetical protein
MHKLKELAMMYAGIAAYWVVWFGGQSQIVTASHQERSLGCILSG